MLERFLQKVMPEPNTGCWYWTGSLNSDGYGLFGIGGSGNTDKAHRVSYRLHKGKIPEGMFVCHACDEPCCVNPDHLFIGSPADNVRDRDRKGRKAVGEQNGKSKLTFEIVRYIRRRSDLSERQIAKELGFHRGTINAVRSGRTWGHVQ